MRVRLLTFCGVFAALGLGLVAAPERDEVRARSKIEGTWEHMIPGQRLRQVSVFTRDYRIWTTYDTETKIAHFTAGGPYTLEGDTYKEQIEFGRFGGAKLQELVGKEQVLKVTFDADLMRVTGTLSNGAKLAEVYQRVK